MAIKCQHKQHDHQELQFQAKKSLIDEEKPQDQLSADVQEKHELQHLKHDWFEKDKDILKVMVYIKHLKKELLNVSVMVDELNVQFATSDEKFLSMYPGTTENTLFNWNIKLRGKIEKNNCSFKVLKYMIEITLKKEAPVRWKSLQQPNLTGLQTKNCAKEFTKIIPDSPVKPLATNGESDQTAPHEGNGTHQPIKQCNDIPGNEDSSTWDGASAVNGESAPSPNVHNGMTVPPPAAPVPPPTPPTVPLIPPTKSGVIGGGSMQFSEAIRAAAAAKTEDEMEDNNTDMDFLANSITIKKGFTGLENLGNTCYLNSIVQCLANTRPLRDYFLSGEFKEDLNSENPLGLGGRLAVVFANLMKHIWSGKYRHVPPQQLKILVGEKVCQFKGFMQQDAQEFMAFLLDGLHEDLNRIRKKPYTEEVEGAGRPDHEVAEEAWSRYKSRNDSIIVDLFQGQLKSKLTCPVCKKISIKFDPFMNLSVPLPKEQKLLNVVVFFKDPSRTPMKLILKVAQEANLEQLTAAVEKKTGVMEENMRVFEEFQGKFHKFFERGSSLSNVVSSDNIYVFEVLSIEEAGEEVYIVPVLQRLLYPLSIPLHCADCFKNEDPSDPLKRCLGCYAIGYCNRKCQERHWPSHKRQCKKGGKHSIGSPFIVSMPASQATFTRLKDLAGEYAKYSVEVRDGEPAKEEPPENEKNDPQTSEEQPRFFFKPVNIYGEPVMGTDGARLTDQGDQPLDLTDRILALDWRNNPKTKNWVNVKTKKLECEQHPSCESEELSTSYSCTLNECLELFTEPETLGKDDAWYCPKCKVHQQATKQLSVWKLPEILIIHLKRFSFRNILYRDKITKLVEFPLSGLDMSSYTVDKGSSNDVYDLFAVSNHMGTVNFGHYTAYAKTPEGCDTQDERIGWRYCDDRSVTNSIEDRVLSKCAYVLFYQRRRRSQLLRQPYGNQSVPTNFAKPSSVTKEPSENQNHNGLPGNERPRSSPPPTGGNSRTTKESCTMSEEAEPLNNENCTTYDTNQTEEKDQDSRSEAPNNTSDRFPNGDVTMQEGISPSHSTGDSYLDQSEVDESGLD